MLTNKQVNRSFLPSIPNVKTSTSKGRYIDIMVAIQEGTSEDYKPIDQEGSYIVRTGRVFIRNADLVALVRESDPTPLDITF
jgi:hypothetical protein